MLKFLIVALLVIPPALPAFGATPAAEHSAPAHASAVHQTTHPLTAAQRRARLKRLEHERAVRRMAAERRLRAQHMPTHRTVKRATVARRTVTRRRAVQRPVTHRVVAHRTLARGTGTRRVVAHRTVVKTAYARRLAAHRAYEEHLAYERRVRAHRAYEAHLVYERRLARERAAAHLSYERQLAKRRADERQLAQEHAAEVHGVRGDQPDREIAKAEVPSATPGPASGTVNPASLDYVSHAHVHLYWVSPLRGSHASLVRQDERDRAEGLTRIKDETQLRELVREHSLIPLPQNEDIQADPRLAYDRRYTRPWTADFLRELGVAFTHRFGEPLVITSAVRPATYQERLTWRNGNAAPANGAIASPHEFGATIDIGKKGMTAREMAWMRGYLLPLQQAGQIDVEEEFYEACFHITVYKSYVPAPVAPAQPEVANTQVDTDSR